jgi:cysteine desulfurase
MLVPEPRIGTSMQTWSDADMIYLDNQATTPTDPRVRDAMLPFLGVDAVGNPHSEHVAGRRADAAVEEARLQVANLIGASPEEIVFTSGATEANNLALQGIARSRSRRGNHIVTCATEHKCVLETVSYLGRTGFRIDYLPPESSGLVDTEALARSIGDDTAMVSIMAANNEIGVLQPIAEIAAICRARDVIFHTDAAQAAGKTDIDVKALGVDLMSLSAHKLYAPIGIGALYVSEECRAELEPISFGGGQERGLRSGTIAPYLCVAFGVAAQIAARERVADAQAATSMRERFLELIRRRLPDFSVNGERSPRLPGNLSLTIPGVDADRLVGTVQPDLAVSTNAACSSGVLTPSHVLLALGMSLADAASTIRVGFGRFNTMAEVEAAAERLTTAALAIRQGETTEIIAA